MRYVLAAVLCLLTLSAQTKKSAYDKPTMEAYVRHLLAVLPEVQVKIDDPKPAPIANMNEVDVHFTFQGGSQDEIFYVSKDGEHIVRGLIYDVNQSPFKADLDKLKTDLAPSYGTPGAKVVLVSFGDFECPLCKEEALALRQNLEKAFPGQVRVYFKNFPLASIHPWAKPAALAGRCIFEEKPAAFWQYHDWIYEHQGEITPDNFKAKLSGFATTANLDAMQFGRCVDTNAQEAEIDKELAEGKTLHIDATPTIFVNGRRLVGNVPWSNLQQLISGELNYQKIADNASEKCCEIKIPTALGK